MIIGVPKEIKKHENRVSLLPSGVEILTQHGHTILVENNAGLASGHPNQEYIDAGAKIIDTPEEIFASANLIVKVKEPQPSEYNLIREGQIVFTYFHFASSEELTHAMINSKCVAIAYETIEDKDRSLPLLTPMSEVAGRMAVQQGARYLQREKGGRGLLLGGVPGVGTGTVLILGGGVVGINAASMASGLGAQTYILDVSLPRLRYLSEVMPSNVITMMSNPHNIRSLLPEADLVINGVLIPGAKAPKLITRKMLSTMKPGSVIVDVSIDQGGAVETSKPTDHENPTYVVDDIIHYCVANMPGAVPVTSTVALTNATFPYLLQIANNGLKAIDNPSIALGVNVMHGKVTYEGVAEAFDLPYSPLKDSLTGLYRN